MHPISFRPFLLSLLTTGLLQLETQAGTPALVEKTPTAFPFEITFGGTWDSRYVSEGRDNLDGDSLFSYALAAGYENWTLGFWQAESPDVAYTELNLFLEYAREIGPFEVYAGYTYLRYPDDEDDEESEVGAGIAYTALPWNLTPAADWYYSFLSKGSFYELSLSSEIPLGDRLVLIPAAVIGFNEGYVGAGHRGANHTALVLELLYAVNDWLEVGGYAAYNWAIDSQPSIFEDDEVLGDYFYGGVGFAVRF